jgi:3',5'-cyclic AMP phosphodiesterase CpdA
VDTLTLEPLIATVRRARPHVVAVSGDLTQRARPREFEAAREFLEALPQPRIVVPGNHDVPLHNPYGRFVRGFAAFREFITDDPYPFYSDREIAVIGVNTARSLAFKGGRINGEQVDAIRQRLCASAGNLVKIVVTHHPFDKPQDSEHALVGRAGTAMKQLAVCGVDVFLSGHLHATGICQTAVRYRIAGHSALVVHAGTATSTRGRGEPNSFNMLHVDRSSIRVERYVWDSEGAGFVVSAEEKFEYTDDGWVPAGVQSVRLR